MKIYLSIILLGLNLFVYTQDKIKFTNLYGDYLGQIPPEDAPIVFAPGIVSTEKHEHSSPAFSRDGQEIYWSVIHISNDSVYQHIYCTKRIKNRWTIPSLVSFSNHNYYEGGPVISADNQKLYIYRCGPVPSDGDAEGLQILKFKRHGNQWGNPEVIIEGGFFTIAQNGNIYYKIGKEIHEAEYIDNKYQPPVMLDDSINTGWLNWTPFVAPDESYLIFSSHRKGNFGDGDLYISFSKEDGSWTAPVNMGTSINTQRQERFPYVSPDGKYLFFTRRNPPNQDDIWWVSTDIIEILKKDTKYK